MSAVEPVPFPFQNGMHPRNVRAAHVQSAIPHSRFYYQYEPLHGRSDNGTPRESAHKKTRHFITENRRVFYALYMSASAVVVLSADDCTVHLE